MKGINALLILFLVASGAIAVAQNALMENWVGMILRSWTTHLLTNMMQKPIPVTPTGLPMKPPG